MKTGTASLIEGREVDTTPLIVEGGRKHHTTNSGGERKHHTTNSGGERKHHTTNS